MEVCDDDDKSSLEEMLNDRPSSADMDEAVLEDVWIKVEHTTKESEQQPSPTQPVTSSQPSAKSSLIVTSEPAVTSSMRKRKQVDAKLIKNGYKSRPTLAQVERLLDMVESKQSILLAPVRTQAARVHNAAVWKEIAARVNYKEGKGEKIGCVKDWRQWNQYWHAKKLSVKMKAHAILQKRLPSEALSDVERRVLELVRGGGGEPGLQNKTVFEDVVEEVVLEDPLSTTPPDPEPTPQETSHTPVTPQVTSNVPTGPKVTSQTPKTIKFKPLKFLKIRRPLQNIKVNNKVESEPKPPETSQLPVIPTESLHLPNTPPITSQAPITDLVTSYVPTMPKLTPKPIQLRTPQRFLKIARTFEPVRVVSSPTNNVTTANVTHNGVTQPVTVTTARAEPAPETAGSRLTTITTHPIQRRRLKPKPDLDPNRTQPGQITNEPLPIDDRPIDMEMSSIDIECQSEITLTNDVTEGIVNKASVSEREEPTSETASSKLASIIRPTIKRRRRPIPDPEPNRTQSQVTDRLLTIEERRIDIEMKSIECQRAAVRAQEEMAKGMQAMAKAVTESFSLLAKAITDVSRTIHQYHSDSE